MQALLQQPLSNQLPLLLLQLKALLLAQMTQRSRRFRPRPSLPPDWLLPLRRHTTRITRLSRTTQDRQAGRMATQPCSTRLPCSPRHSRLLRCQRVGSRIWTKTRASITISILRHRRHNGNSPKDRPRCLKTWRLSLLWAQHTATRWHLHSWVASSLWPPLGYILRPLQGMLRVS